MSSLNDDLLKCMIKTMAAVGSAEFYASLLGMMERLVPGDNAQVIQYPQRGVPRYLVAHQTPETIQRQYLSRYHRFDPYYQLLRGSADYRVIRGSEIRPRDYDGGGYYSQFYSSTGVDDDIGVILPGGGTYCTGLFVGRKGDFAPIDREMLEVLYPVFLRLNFAHRHEDPAAPANRNALPLALYDAGGEVLFENPAWAQLRDAGTIDLEWALAAVRIGGTRAMHFTAGNLCIETVGFNDRTPPTLRMLMFVPHHEASDAIFSRAFASGFLAGLLTPRERQIVSLVFVGCDNVQISMRLAISEGTVRNHRKRLYRKLGINSERELFTRLIVHLAESGQ